MRMNRVRRMLLLLCLPLISGCGEKQASTASKTVVPVAASAAVRKDVPMQLSGIGTVEALATVTVRSLVSGELKRVHFKEGEEVRKGDLLFSIDSRTFESDLKRAEANLAKNLAASKQAQANEARDAAEAKNAELEARRYERLIGQGIISQEEYDRARTRCEALRATLDASHAARENIEEAIRADRAAVENAKIQLEYCSIRSTIDGRTGTLLVHEGNLLRANDTVLVVINQIAPLSVNFSLPERYLDSLKTSFASAKVPVEASPGKEDSTRSKGVLAFIDNTVDSATGTIRLKARFANADRKLWPGQFANVVLTLGVERSAVVVPSHAVQPGQTGSFVFVVSPEQTAESRPVQAGRTVGGETVIESGLQAGELVITDGHLRLVPGSKVEIKTLPEGGQAVRP